MKYERRIAFRLHISCICWGWKPQKLQAYPAKGHSYNEQLLLQMIYHLERYAYEFLEAAFYTMIPQFPHNCKGLCSFFSDAAAGSRDCLSIFWRFRRILMGASEKNGQKVDSLLKNPKKRLDTTEILCYNIYHSTIYL